MADLDSPYRRMLPLLREEQFHVLDNGDIQRGAVGPTPETPWIYQNMSFQCILWHQVFFEHIAEHKMVHSHCHECYKVCITPRIVSELISLEQWQSTLDVPCKCGIELREWVPKLYGGYFYCRGVEEGRERYREVKRFAYENAKERGLQPESSMPVILKKGCSEFERACGPSDKWEISDEQEEFEQWMAEKIIYDPFGDSPQPEVIKESVRLAWLKWAHMHGDMSYVQYTPNKKPFGIDYITYHEDD
jgi:hypothetical protein